VLKNVQESLAGRVGIVSLLGFSLAEIQETLYLEEPFRPDLPWVQQTFAASTPQLFDHILRGSFPALWDETPLRREVFFSSYLQTYIDRDLRDIFGVTKLSEFHTFIQLCAARTGQVLNYSDLARDAGISVHAAREWINILISTRHIFLLEPYFANIGKRLIKSPKLYFLDTGLGCYLTKWNDAGSLQAGAMAGAFFETFVVSELVKSYLFRGHQIPLYYLRDQQGHEIDLLIADGQALYPVEIKLASSIKTRDIEHIRYYRSRLKLGKGAVISSTLQPYALDAETQVLPFSSIS